jgi:predicted  nucleic acid-binding Zn-ribbon protein
VADVSDESDALLALADHDEALLRARHAVEHPPSRAALEEASGELDRLRVAKRALDVDRVPHADRAAVLERDAATARERAAAIGARLDAATGAGRELEAMAHERDVLLDRASAIEDELLDVLVVLEPLDAQDAGLRAAALDARDRETAAAAAAATERDRADAELRALEASRPALADAVEPSLRARYEAVAQRRGGVGAARLIDGRCGACHVTVPSGLEDEILHATDPLAVVLCDECGRLLVR